MGEGRGMSDEVMSYEGLGTRTQSFNVNVINKQFCDFFGKKKHNKLLLLVLKM